ncbi:MAG: AAA family ATPase [Sporocytophaga sp.]|nr:AAA family ATPase [Sporocytophaga sp.]
MEIKIPELALVMLIGASGSGKSTFARRHFKSTEILTSDFCRAIVSDDENDQSATEDAFSVLKYIAGIRLKKRFVNCYRCNQRSAGSKKRFYKPGERIPLSSCSHCAGSS